jgi:hypothetical protein
VPQLFPAKHEPTHVQIAEQGTDHSPYTKGNFEFESVISEWRAIRPELDMRRKG